VVVDRPGYSAAVKRGWMSLPVEPVDVSSTELRDQLRAGRDVSAHLTPAVMAEVRARNLYRVGASA
ncbi:MAG: nicotinic acid mononucleotide adenylyltransferase, partial [Actinomycetota bacterium]